MPRLALLLSALLFALVGATALPRVAHAEVEWSNRATETEDPRSITFRIRASVPGGLNSAVVEYRVLGPDGSVGGSVRVSPPSGNQVDLSATLETIAPNRYIPVGSEVVYAWELEATDGTVTRTPEERFTFLDGRYRWQERSQDGVTVFWYGDSDRNADLALRATYESITDIGELLQVEMPYPVRVVVWRESSDGRMAQRPRGGAFDEMVVTGGSRVAPDLLHIYDALGGFVDVARHEAAHLITRVAGDGPFTRVPSWLDEGTAVYAQNSPGNYEVAIRFAISSDQTLRLRTMTSPTNRADLVNIFYGQSWSTVNFMIEEFGEERFAELFSTIKAGSRTDEALQEVYGFDQDGLYNLWREHVGLDPIEYEPREQGADRPRADATRAPLGIPSGIRPGGGGAPAQEPPAPGEPVADTHAASEPGGVPTMALVILAITLLLAGGLGGLGVKLLRSK